VDGRVVSDRVNGAVIRRGADDADAGAVQSS
jgi:hypothetical protein